MSGCQGCFQQHGIEESQILHCHLSFYYESYEDEEMDVDKEIFFHEYAVLDAWESIPTGWNGTSPRTDSDEAFEVARAWKADCLSDSHKLYESPQSPPLPTRVVDVGLQDDVVKLIEPEGATGRYFCLSHCWGLEQIITTTRANLQVHKREIPLNLLPQTFRDAVLLTRRLGIAYIWIDSLCIVQDDNNNWKVESGKMERIYRNAHLTIAATRSSSGAGGLYAVTPKFEVSSVSSSGENYSLFFREKIDHHTEYITARSI
ncbi:Heterokaryon incompatibility protein (HET) domain containing protein [Hyaloscypha variabilis]